MKINIVTPESGWFISFANKLLTTFKLSHEAIIVHDHNEIKAGSNISFFLSYPNMVPLEILNHSKFNLVAHASDLPKGRGMSPWVWDIVNGANYITITIFEMAPQLDTGDFYFKENIQLDGTELLNEIREKLGDKIVMMCFRFVQDFNSHVKHKQQGEPTYFKKRSAQDSELDINKTLLEQFNLLRVVDNKNYPAYFYHLGRKYILSITKE